MSALFAAIERGDLALVRLLLDAGATSDEDAFYHACEQSDTALLDALGVPALHRPGLENLVNHKLDFEDLTGLRWFLDRGVDVNAHRCLHHAISRGRGVPILTALIDGGADVNLPWDRWDVGRRPLALAARSGHLAAFQLLRSRGATADLDPVDAAVLAVARGESVHLPKAPAPALGNPDGEEYGWILGQFALLGRTEVVRTLLDSGLPVDTRGWSNFTPLDQAAMHGRTQTVQLLIDRGADLHDCAFDEDGPHPAGLRHLGHTEQPRRGRRLPRHRAGAACRRRPDPAPSTHRRPSCRHAVDEPAAVASPGYGRSPAGVDCGNCGIGLSASFKSRREPYPSRPLSFRCRTRRTLLLIERGDRFPADAREHQAEWRGVCGRLAEGGMDPSRRWC